MQIETSNYCSLACAYCPHPSQVRPKGNMSMDTFEKCMTLVERSDNPVYDGRKFVWLNHFGEPLLNPLLPDFVAYAQTRGIEVSFASNAVDGNSDLFPKALWKKLADCGLKGVHLSAHNKNPRVLAEHVGDVANLLGIWTPTRENLHDWAGQVDLSKYKLAQESVPDHPCDYNTNNMFAVTWDGRVAACCYDIEARVGLTVDDVLDGGFLFREISLCGGCSLGRGDVNWLLEPLVALLG